MLDIKKANKILNMILENDQFNGKIIIEYGENFCYFKQKNLNNFKIAISNNFNFKNFKKYIKSYLLNFLEFNIDNTEINDIYEVFGLLHEVGHIYTYDNWYEEEYERCYNDYKNKKYNSEYSAFIDYRNIPMEYDSDIFAINIIKKYKKELLLIMNNN